MAVYNVTIGSKVTFAPESTVEEILQNIRTIISTRVGTVPLDRDFGVDWSMLDRPLPVAKTLLQSEIIQKINTYEPRAKVQSVDYEYNESEAADGLLRPTVVVDISEEYL